MNDRRPLSEKEKRDRPDLENAPNAQEAIDAYNVDDPNPPMELAPEEAGGSGSQRQPAKEDGRSINRQTP